MRCRSATDFELFVLKTVSFTHKSSQSCHCEERSDAAILKPEARYPVAKLRENLA